MVERPGPSPDYQHMVAHTSYLHLLINKKKYNGGAINASLWVPSYERLCFYSKSAHLAGLIKWQTYDEEPNIGIHPGFL